MLFVVGQPTCSESEVTTGMQAVTEGDLEAERVCPGESGQAFCLMAAQLKFLGSAQTLTRWEGQSTITLRSRQHVQRCTGGREEQGSSAGMERESC